jgi:hypothetical protein
MAADLKLSITCGPYDRAQALIDGTVKPQGIELAVTLNDDDVDRQLKCQRGLFDVAESFTGTYIADLPRKKLGLTAIPIFVKRMFRHSYIYLNTKSRVRKASELNGKRVGLQTWITTAALWVVPSTRCACRIGRRPPGSSSKTRPRANRSSNFWPRADAERWGRVIKAAGVKLE